MLELQDEAMTGEQATPARWTAKDLLDTDTLSPDQIELVMETAEAMHEVRTRPVGKVAWMKLCISVGLAKVKVGVVFRVMNTLLELMLVVPDW